VNRNLYVEAFAQRPDAFEGFTQFCGSSGSIVLSMTTSYHEYIEL
jgi:hypothetical protein